MDALKLDWYGAEHGLRAVATLGLHLTDGKVGLITELASRFDRIVVLLDSGAVHRALGFSEQLAMIGAEVGTLPAGRDDPGEMSAEDVEYFAEIYRKGLPLV